MLKRYMDIFLSKIYLLQGGWKGIGNLTFLCFFSIPYLFLKILLKKIKPILYLLPFDCTLTLFYGKFFCRSKKGDIGIVVPTTERCLLKYFYMNKNYEIFIDIGSHIGKYSIIMGRLNKKGKVFSIEPDNENIKILRENVKVNVLKNVLIYPFALGKKGENVNFYYDEYRGTSPSMDKYSFLKLGSKPSLIKAFPIKTLDSLFKNIKKIDLIKVDVEGYELNVFKGGVQTLRNTKYIIFESFPFNKNKVNKFLRHLGFDIHPIDETNFIATNKKLIS